jgi:hypothetical protein
LFILAGCSKGVTVSGTVTFPSNLKFEPTDSVQLMLLPEAKGGVSPPTSCTPLEKKFYAQHVAPGKYKIAAKINANIASPEGAKRAKEIEAFNKSFDRTATKLSYDVTAEDQSITIDFDKGTVTKN